jgi:hypothetical protein
MIINLLPNAQLAAKVEPYSASAASSLAVGGVCDVSPLLMDGPLCWAPREVYEEVRMYLSAHEEYSGPEEPTTNTFSGTEFEIQTEGDEFVMVTVGGTVVGIPTLEAKQLAAWILAQ